MTVTRRRGRSVARGAVRGAVRRAVRRTVRGGGGTHNTQRRVSHEVGREAGVAAAALRRPLLALAQQVVARAGLRHGGRHHCTNTRLRVISLYILAKIEAPVYSRGT